MTIFAAVALCRQAIFEQLQAAGYSLSEMEAKTFLPGLVEKSGQAQAQLRSACRELMQMCCTLYPAPRVMAFIKEGLESKNNRCRGAPHPCWLLGDGQRAEPPAARVGRWLHRCRALHVHQRCLRHGLCCPCPPRCLSRTRVACAEEIGCMIDREGSRIYAGKGEVSAHARARSPAAWSAGREDGSLQAAAARGGVAALPRPRHPPPKPRSPDDPVSPVASGARATHAPLCVPILAIARAQALSLLARLVSERDKDIRAACLATLEVIYSFEGEGRGGRGATADAGPGWSTGSRGRRAWDAGSGR